MLRQEFDEPQIEEMWSAVSRMPVIRTQVQVAGQDVKGDTSSPSVSVKQGREFSVNVTMRRQNKTGKEGLKAHTPKFPKPKDESWLLVIGNPVTRELLALKRVAGVRGSVTHSLVLTMEEEGKVDLCLYIMSDCYKGLDQQYTLPLAVEQSDGPEIFYSDEE